MPGELPRQVHDAHLLKDSEVFAERLLFGHRHLVLLLFAVLTVWLLSLIHI